MLTNKHVWLPLSSPTHHFAKQRHIKVMSWLNSCQSYAQCKQCKPPPSESSFSHPCTPSNQMPPHWQHCRQLHYFSSICTIGQKDILTAATPLPYPTLTPPTTNQTLCNPQAQSSHPWAFAVIYSQNTLQILPASAATRQQLHLSICSYASWSVGDAETVMNLFVERHVWL